MKSCPIQKKGKPMINLVRRVLDNKKEEVEIQIWMIFLANSLEVVVLEDLEEVKEVDNISNLILEEEEVHSVGEIHLVEEDFIKDINNNKEKKSQIYFKIQVIFNLNTF